MYIPNADQESKRIDLSLVDLRPDARPHSEEDLKKLAQSMSARQFQNIMVCRNGKRFEVIVGVGRVLAARMLGWTDIRADIYNSLAEAEKLSMIFDENEDRENPPALYQAQVLQHLLEDQGMAHLTQREIARKIGKDQTTVSKYLALQALSPRIWEDMNRFIKLGLAHFTQLLRIENKEEQWKFTEIILEKGLSVDELRKIIDKKLGVSKVGRPKGTKTLGAGEFRFSQRGTSLRIQANFDLTTDPQTFLSAFGSALLSWRESHPLKNPAPPPAPSGNQKAETVVAPKLHIPETVPTPDEVRELLKGGKPR